MATLLILLVTHGSLAMASFPPKVFSPNPPGCAADVADFVCDITDAALGIVHDTVLCSAATGWHHRERVCASHVVTQLASFSGATGDALAVSFDCFNSNQACGQTITGAIQWALQAVATLVSLIDTCEPPSGPWSSEQALNGFNCWRRTWHIIQRLLKTAKFIDVAVNTCPEAGSVTEDTLPQIPEYTNTTGVAGLDSSTLPPRQAENTSLGAQAPAAEETADGSDGGVWGMLSQVTSLVPGGAVAPVAPVERRRLQDQQQGHTPVVPVSWNQIHAGMAELIGSEWTKEDLLSEPASWEEVQEMARAFAVSAPEGHLQTAMDLHV